MKMAKLTSITLFSFILMWAFMPSLSAKHHHKYRVYKSRSTSTAFGLNLNFDARPRYVEYNNYMAPPPAPMPIPAPCYERVVVAPLYRPVVEQRVYYPAPVYREQVIVERPYAPSVYIQPQFSYWRY